MPQERTQSQPKSSRLVGLYHVQMPVTDIDASVRWYTERLGFRETHPSSERHAFLATDDDVMLMFWKTTDDTSANFTVNGRPFPVLLYRTCDIHGLHDRLKEQGNEIAEFQDEGMFWVLKFFDLNGNMLGALQDK